MKRLLLPLIAALALPTAVNAEVIPKIAFGKKKSYSKVFYKGVFDKMKILLTVDLKLGAIASFF